MRSLCVLLAGAILAAGCSDSPTNPSPVTFTQTDVRAGAGAEATAGKSITVHYTGWLYDESKADKKGLMFETSAGSDPFTFTLGAGQVIAGWDRGLVGLREGGIRRLIIPPSLAYGGIRTGQIPPYTPIVFDVELLEVQ